MDFGCKTCLSDPGRIRPSSKQQQVKSVPAMTMFKGPAIHAWPLVGRWPLAAGYNTVWTVKHSLGHSEIQARVLGVGSGAWPSCLGPGQGRDLDSFLWPLVWPLAVLTPRLTRLGPSVDHWLAAPAVAASQHSSASTAWQSLAVRWDSYSPG